jgi:hypothetical protein
LASDPVALCIDENTESVFVDHMIVAGANDIRVDLCSTAKRVVS